MSFESSSKETTVVLPLSAFARTASAERSTELPIIATVKPVTSRRFPRSFHLILSKIFCFLLSTMVFPLSNAPRLLRAHPYFHTFALIIVVSSQNISPSDRRTCHNTVAQIIMAILQYSVSLCQGIFPHLYWIFPLFFRFISRFTSGFISGFSLWFGRGFGLSLVSDFVMPFPFSKHAPRLLPAGIFSLSPPVFITLQLLGATMSNQSTFMWIC